MDLFDVYPLFDLEPVRGEGAYVYTADGSRYLDFYGGHAVISIGHAHPTYVAAIQEQVAKLGFYSNSVQNSLQRELARKLGEASGLEEYQLFLCNSGAEANENALKLASFATGRSRVIAFRRGFHGRTSAAVNATDNERIKAPINKHYPITHLDLGNAASLERELSAGDVAAVIVEGIQGIGGVYVPEPEFLLAAQKLCAAAGTVLILDEIQSGYGRSGRFFAFQYAAGLEPDIVSMAKGMGNGFPIGGILIHPRHRPVYGMLGTTFGGNHLACAAGIAVLDALHEEKMTANAAELGTYLKAALEGTGIFEEVRGRGLIIGCQFDRPVGPLRKRLLFEEHVFTGSAGDPNTVRLLPPLNIDQAACDYLVEKMRLVFES